jgi:hypothetical protein
MCRRDMIRVTLQVGVWEGLSSRSVLGWMREVMLVWVGVCGVHVRFKAIGTMYTCVLSKCERRSFARGCFL